MNRIGAPIGFGLLALLVAACTAPTDGGQGAEELAGNEAVASPIIGGKTASAYPEAALIDMYRNGQLYAACSGSVIAPRVVLTAGHCVAGTTGWRVTTPYAGNQRSQSSSGTTYDWKDDGSDQVNPNEHDIGLVFLDTPITLSSYPKLTTGPVADGSQLVNLGRIQDGKLSSTDLFYGAAVTVRNASSSGFPYDYVSTDIIQSGDSGGPVEIPNTHTIAAVNSGAGGGTQVLARVDLLNSWIQGQIASHGGGGGGGSSGGGGTGGGGTGGTCTGASESEPNDAYTAPNALGASVCGAIGSSSDQDWFTWSIAGATPYDLKLKATGDASIQMWKLVSGQYYQVANTSATEIAHTASGAGQYLVAVYSPSGATQSYSMTLQK